MSFRCLQFSQKMNENNSTWGSIVVIFSFVYWEDWRYQKDILKSTDLYQSLTILDFLGKIVWNNLFSYLKWPQKHVLMHLQVTRVGPPRPNFSLQSILMQNSSKISNVATRLANRVEFVKSSQRTAIRRHGLRTWKIQIGKNDEDSLSYH